MSVTVSVSGDIALRDQLALLRLNGPQRRKYHRMLGREVAKRSRARIKAQKGLDGQGWPARKSGRRRMLTRLMRPKHLRITANDQAVKVTWKNNLMGQIARRHQEGIGETMTAQRAAKIANRRHGEPDYQGDATAAQAKALVKAGFRIYAGKTKSGRVKTRRVSQRWIRENMTLGQAGLVLRLIRDEPSKQQWEIPLPERDFLGLAPDERASVGQELLKTLTDNAVRRRG